MNQKSGTQRSLGIPYPYLRRGIGLIGMGLPVVLIVGKLLIKGPGIEDSISAYYYSVMGDVLVGSLCAIGVFLVLYRYRERNRDQKQKQTRASSERYDNIAAAVAGISAIGVALFPTVVPEIYATKTAEGAEIIFRGFGEVGPMHGVFAGLLLFMLGYMSLFRFTKTYSEDTKESKKPLEVLSLLMVTRTKEKKLRTRKRFRNGIYRICGYTIFACLVAMGIVLARGMGQHPLDPIFWIETIAIEAFGIAWLVKGGWGLFLNDRPGEDSGEKAIATPTSSDQENSGKQKEA